MKYVVFAIAFLGVLPIAWLASHTRATLRALSVFLVLPLVAFQSTSMNLFAIPLYRGSARGMEISVIYLAAAAILLAVLFRYHRLKLIPGPGYVFYLLYCIGALWSFPQADQTLLSWLELWKLFMMALIFLAVWNELRATGDFDTYWYALAGFIVWNFAIIVWNKYFGLHIYQARGVFPHQNSLAMFMVMVGPIFLARLLEERRLPWGVFWAAIFGLTTLSSMWTYSRGAMFSYPLACTLTILSSLLVRFHVRKLILISIIGVLGLLSLSIFIPRIIERINRAPTSSRLTRLYLAQVAIKMANSNAHGVGLNNWTLKVDPEVHPEFHEDIYVNHELYERIEVGIVESAYLLIAAECGWGTLVVYLCLLFYLLYVAVKLSWKLRHSELFYLPAGCIGGLLACYFQTMLEWVLKQSMNFILMMILFAMLSFLNYAQAHRLITNESAPANNAPVTAKKSPSSAGAAPEASDATS